MENGAFAPKEKCSIFHNIVKYMIFQRHQTALLWSRGLSTCNQNMYKLSDEKIITILCFYVFIKKLGLPSTSSTVIMEYRVKLKDKK